MEYRVLWFIAFISILMDFGLTAVAIQDPHFREANPTSVGLMDDYGVVGGMVITVLIRWIILGIGIIMQYVAPDHSWIPVVVLLPASIYPVLHNIVVIATLIF